MAIAGAAAADHGVREERTKTALNAELADVHLAAKRLRTREATRLSASSRVRLIEGIKLKILLTMYVLADCRHEPAVPHIKRLDRLGRQHRWPQKSNTELTVLVEDMFLAADRVQLVNLSNFDDDDSHTLLAATCTTPLV